MSKNQFLTLFGTAIACGLALKLGLGFAAAGARARAAVNHQQRFSYPHGVAIPNAASVPSDKEFCHIYKTWMHRIAVAEYEKTPHARKDVSAFLDDGIAYLKGVNVQTEQKAAAQGIQLDKQGVTDPVFKLFAGLVIADPATKQRFLNESLNGLEQSSYPRFLAFMAAANLAKSLDDQGGANAQTLKVLDDKALRYLEQGLNARDVTDEEMPALRWRLCGGSVDSLILRRGADVVDVVERSTIVAPWLKHYLSGRRYLKEAWKSRGSGWSDTVTREGWRGFAQNLAFARENYTRSWELNPKDPAAAADMIEVAMGESNKTEMRHWFDRAVAAQFDFEPAYDKLTWGLRPRWFGSHEEMLTFGRECIATNRFDTCVPYRYINIVREIASEQKDPNTIYKQHEIIDPARQTLDRYLKMHDPPFAKSYGHTLAAIIAYKAGDLRSARQEMQELQFHADPASDLSDLQNLAEMIAKLKALGPQDKVQRVSLQNTSTL
jgi:hypothetical protein